MNKQAHAEILEATIASYSLMARLENLQRMGYYIHKDKQVLNRCIKHLKTKEKIVDALDKNVGIDTIDLLMKNFDNFVKEVSKIPPAMMEEFTEVARNFRELREEEYKKQLNKL